MRIWSSTKTIAWYRGPENALNKESDVERRGIKVKDSLVRLIYKTATGPVCPFLNEVTVKSLASKDRSSK